MVCPSIPGADELANYGTASSLPHLRGWSRPVAPPSTDSSESRSMLSGRQGPPLLKMANPESFTKSVSYGPQTEEVGEQPDPGPVRLEPKLGEHGLVLS